MELAGISEPAVAAGLDAPADPVSEPAELAAADDDAADDSAAEVGAAEVAGEAADEVDAESLAFEQALSTSPRTATAETAAIRYVRRCMVVILLSFGPRRGCGRGRAPGEPA
jgi:hypothetical protein